MLPKIIIDDSNNNFVNRLPDGLYLLTIKSFDITEKNNSQYLRLTCSIEDTNVDSTYKGKLYSVFVNLAWTWKLAMLFEAIGLKKPNQRYEVEWDKLPNKQFILEIKGKNSTYRAVEF